MLMTSKVLVNSLEESHMVTNQIWSWSEENGMDLNSGKSRILSVNGEIETSRESKGLEAVLQQKDLCIIV